MRVSKVVFTVWLHHTHVVYVYIVTGDEESQEKQQLSSPSEPLCGVGSSEDRVFFLCRVHFTTLGLAIYKSDT